MDFLKNIPMRKHLSTDALINEIYEWAKKVTDSRSEKDRKIPISDAIMSGYAIFSLKNSSLLEFQNQIRDNPNLRRVFKISRLMSDTQIREILDRIEIEEFEPIFKKIFAHFQRGKELEKFTYLGGYHILSSDGTGYFSSTTIHCENCLEKKNKKTGEVKEYYHQMYSASIVHPDMSTVIPLMPEPIIKQDGSNKNDCERNASKRFYERFRRNHPHLKIIAVEDGLASNAPHIRLLQSLDIRYIIGAKEKDHKYLYQEFDVNRKNHKTTQVKIEKGQITHIFSYINGLSLNESNQDLKVNVLEYHEVNKKDNKMQVFVWVTDLEITESNVYEMMKAGRVRWKIENETFNTLKNQGYHFEHNFGHGHKNLSEVFAMLMTLAFLVDQIQQIVCPLVREILTIDNCKKRLWNSMRSIFDCYVIHSMEEVFRLIVRIKSGCRVSVAPNSS